MGKEPTGSEKIKPDEEGSAATGKVAAPLTSPETDAERSIDASKLVDRFAMWAGAAGLIPVPIVDLAAIGGLQLQMLRRISEIYGVPFSANLGKSIIASLAGSMIPLTSGISAASAIKAIPFFGTAVSTLTLPALSAGATYAIGKVFIQHFASGGTLLDLNAPDYREFIKAQKEIFSLRSTAPKPTAAQSPEPSDKATATDG
jgi:uncharacterized protein (DUF697 family)